MRVADAAEEIDLIGDLLVVLSKRGGQEDGAWEGNDSASQSFSRGGISFTP